MHYLNGRVAIVTGGARGVGLAISQQIVAHGAKVLVADNGANIPGTEIDASKTADAVASLGKSAFAYDSDIGSYESACSAVEQAVERWGKVDLVINCAAILRDHFIFKSRPEDFDEVLRVNLSGAYYLLAAATPIIRQQAKAAVDDAPYSWGRVINIVSTAGFYGNYGQSAYASAKSGLMGLTRAAALDLRRDGITVNAVAPFARTRVTDTIIPANDEQALYKNRAMKISTKYVATMVVWLCSDLAYPVSGQLFGVRGREIFLFSQARPMQRVTVPAAHWDVKSLDQAASENFSESFTELTTDLEEFNTEPFV